MDSLWKPGLGHPTQPACVEDVLGTLIWAAALVLETENLQISLLRFPEPNKNDSNKQQHCVSTCCYVPEIVQAPHTDQLIQPSQVSQDKGTIIMPTLCMMALRFRGVK